MEIKNKIQREHYINLVKLFESIGEERKYSPGEILASFQYISGNFKWFIMPI